MDQFSNFFYLPNPNYFIYENLFGLNVYFLINAVLIAIIFVLRSVPFVRPSKIQKLKKIERCVLISMFVLIVILQSLGQIQFVMHQDGRQYGRYLLDKSIIKQFALFCREHLPGAVQADFLSDIDISLDPGTYFHRLLAYELYPVDIRNIREGAKKYLIIFYKENAADGIPPGYQILAQMDSMNLIAIKDGEQ